MTQRVLLIVGGGISAYKAPLLVRVLAAEGVAVRCVLTKGGSQFTTALTLGSVSGDRVYADLWDLTDEAEMGHIELSRSADLICVAPATADLMAKMANGLADDLASTLLLATDAPVVIAPAMNVRMWEHAATQSNLATLESRGVEVIGPDVGDMACGEHGPGRMSEPDEIARRLVARLRSALPGIGHAPTPGLGREAPLALASPQVLRGRRAIVTSGPTHEPIDPVRYIANRSSGKQGHAIAGALARLGADVTLVHGPVAIEPPEGVRAIPVETAREMREAVMAALPADVMVAAAAVADYRVEAAGQKLKKEGGTPQLALVENPDILAEVAGMGEGRPALVVGFAAETENVIPHARAKRERKRCDWLLANDVSGGAVFGQDANAVTLVTATGDEPWPEADKHSVAERLAARIGEALA